MALGIFYRAVPDSFIVRLFQGIRGNLDKSVLHNRKAIDLSPNNITHNKELGVSLLCRGKKKGREDDIMEGKKYLQRALELPARDARDRIDQEDSKRLLADHSLSCRYSRSNQLEDFSKN